MNGHEPECIQTDGDCPCICDLLHRVELRVIGQIVSDLTAQYHYGRKVGYAEGRRDAERDVRDLMYPPGEPIRIDSVRRTMDVARIIATAGGST